MKRPLEPFIGFQVDLPIEPPTCTHHAKQIGNGRMFDSKPLIAARNLIAGALAFSGKRPPRPLGFRTKNTEGQPRRPLMLGLEFIFGGATHWHPYSHKPDCDNLAKTTTDLLVKDGWITADELIADQHITKTNAPGAGRISIIAREIHPDKPRAISLVDSTDLHIWDFGPTPDQIRFNQGATR